MCQQRVPHGIFLPSLLLPFPPSQLSLSRSSLPSLLSPFPPSFLLFFSPSSFLSLPHFKILFFLLPFFLPPSTHAFYIPPLAILPPSHCNQVSQRAIVLNNNHACRFCNYYHLLGINYNNACQQLTGFWDVLNFKLNVKYYICLIYTHFSSSPGFIAMTLPSTTVMAPLVAAETKSLVIWKTTMTMMIFSSQHLH